MEKGDEAAKKRHSLFGWGGGGQFLGRRGEKVLKGGKKPFTENRITTIILGMFIVITASLSAIKRGNCKTGKSGGKGKS